MVQGVRGLGCILASERLIPTSRPLVGQTEPDRYSGVRLFDRSEWPSPGRQEEWYRKAFETLSLYAKRQGVFSLSTREQKGKRRYGDH